MNSKTTRISTTLRYLAVVPLIALGILIIIASGGGGGGGLTLGPTSLATGTFIKDVEPGTDDGNNSFPFDAVSASQRLHQLYLANEINGSGFITKIGFRYDQDLVAAVTCSNTTIRLGHTRVVALTIPFANNVETGDGSLETVINNGTIRIPAGSAGTYFEITLDASFYYNGVDNLVIEFVRNAACTGTVFIDVTTAVFARQANAEPIGATGSVSNILRFTKFTFAGGDNEQNFGGVASSNNSFPFDSETPRAQFLYLASEIDGSGPITGLAFQKNQLSAVETYTATIMMGHSTLATLGTDFAANYSDTPVTVANAVTFDISTGIPAGGWVWVPLPDGTFSYNGSDNLIVDVTTSAATGVTFMVSATIAGRRVQNTDHTATSGTVDSAILHAKLRFNGGTMDVHTIGGLGGLSDAFPFNSTNGKRQYLYHVTELGTKGAITKLACRAQLNNVAVTGFAYTVVMSHTNETRLGTDYAANLPSPLTVFNGTFDVPAALAGDWLEIPLSTPFNYNGADNLVVEIAGTGGSGGFGAPACNLDGANATSYPRRSAESPSSTDTTATFIRDRLIDTRFFFGQ